MSASDGKFPETHWTLIGRLRSADESVARRALDEVCMQYHYPLYCFIRRHGLMHHDAQDALQEFLGKLLRARSFEDAVDEKGKLRTFLLVSLRRFLINWHRDHARQALEVSGDAAPDWEEAAERFGRERFVERETPEHIFDRKWSHELMVGVQNELARDYEAKGRGPLFHALLPVLQSGGSLRGADQAGIAASLSMSEGALRVALSRMLQDFRKILHREVLQTVDSPDDVDREIMHLVQAFHRE
jgi:RNA polymerase sigma-70 factor (ECF subfamily)